MILRSSKLFKEFKSTIQSIGVLAMEFEDTADLEAKVREHLAGVIRTCAGRLSPPTPSDPHVGAAIPTEPLPDITLDVPGTPAEIRTPEQDAALREAVATGTELYLVMDLGGTKAYVSLMTRDAKRLYDKRHATESSADEEGLVRFIEHCVREPLARIGELTGLASDDVHRKVTAIGIAFPGPTDFERGLVLDAPNLRVDDPIPLAARMEQTFSIRTFVDNDVNLAALGEVWKGAARGHSNVVGIMIGTGIGGGLIIDGEIYRGRNKTAGEIGHLVVALDSNVQCGCKQFGCLEALASRRSMARELHNRKRERGVTDRKWLERNLLSNQIAHHFLHGDPDTVAVVTEAGEICGKAVFSILNLLNPDIVVFNGGFVHQLGARFIEPVLLEAKKCMRAVYSLDDKPIPIVVGELPNPVLVGACRMALDASHGKVEHTRQDVFHMLRGSLGDREALLLHDVYETPYGIAPTDNPKSDFHEERLKKLRNLGLIFTDGPSFRRSSKVMVSPLGRMLVEETLASESSGPDLGDPV